MEFVEIFYRCGGGGKEGARLNETYINFIGDIPRETTRLKFADGVIFSLNALARNKKKSRHLC